MEEGQNLVVPGVRSVTNKPSKSVVSFTVPKRQTLSPTVPSHQILAECQTPTLHPYTLSHFQVFVHAVPSAENALPYGLLANSLSSH